MLGIKKKLPVVSDFENYTMIHNCAAVCEPELELPS